MKASTWRYLGAIVTLCLLTVALAQTDTSNETEANVTASSPIITTTTEPLTTTEEEIFYADMVLDDLYHLVYKGKKMLRLQQCLCDSTFSVCKTTIKVPSKFMYEFEFRAEEIIKGEPGDSEEYGNLTFSCHIGDLFLLQTFVCSRQKDSYERCLKQRTCRFVHFTSEDVDGCRSKANQLTCINLALSGYNIEFRNFSGITEFKDGACGKPTPSSTTDPTTSSTTPEFQGPDSKSNILDGKGDNEDIFLIIAVIGWALCVLILVIILFFCICRRRSRRKAKQKEPVSEKSKVIHNGSFGLSNISQGDEEDHLQMPAPPPEVRYEETNRGNIDQQEDSPYLDCEEDDDVYTVIEDETVSNGVTKNMTVTGVKQKQAHNAVSLNVGEDNAFTKSSLKYENSTGAGGPRPAFKNTNEPRKDVVESKALGLYTQPPKQRDTEFEHDYTRLVSGRIDMDSKATDSFLATYNATNDDTDEADAKGERNSENIPYNVDNVDEEKSDSAAYTLVEPENEIELFRDSNGYITVIEEGPVKDKPLVKEKPKTDNTLLRGSADYSTVKKENSVKTKPFTTEEQVNNDTHVPNSSGYTQANKGQYTNVKLFDKDGQENDGTLNRNLAGYTTSTNEASSKVSTLPNEMVEGKPYSTQTLEDDVGTRLSGVCSTAEQGNGTATGQASLDTSLLCDPYSVAHPITLL